MSSLIGHIETPSPPYNRVKGSQQASTHSLLIKLSLVCIDTHVNSREVIKAIEADGWRLKRVRGSHHHYVHPTKPGIVTVPHPRKDMPLGTLRSVERQSGIKLR